MGGCSTPTSFPNSERSGPTVMSKHGRMRNRQTACSSAASLWPRFGMESKDSLALFSKEEGIDDTPALMPSALRPQPVPLH